MAAIESITFTAWNGRRKTVRFSPDEDLLSAPFRTTVITGQNGSHKSTLLREVVAALALPNTKSTVRFADEPDLPVHVVCVSGSVADRFPSKELAGGGISEFDVPNYVYLGQRVGTNLLSKKRPLETLLASLLDDQKANRCSWDFFERAHEFAGIKPHVQFDLIAKRGSSKENRVDVIRSLQAVSKGQSTDRSRQFPKVSAATANWLLDEFDYDSFSELERLLERPGRKKTRVLLGDNGATSDTASSAALRLGLVTDLLTLSDVRVRSRSGGSEFSAFELSSGEYHMYSTILGLGFVVDAASVVLIDEPENSLHPQWQRAFMESVWDISKQVLRAGHVVICTHSPLIVSATWEGTTVVDLTYDSSDVEPAPLGASSDEVLLTQFGVGSSRNPLVVDIVQRAVSLVERGDFHNPDFESLRTALVTVRHALSRGDPLVEVINALLEEEETDGRRLRQD